MEGPVIRSSLGGSAAVYRTFLQGLGPALAALLDAAVADGAVRDDISAEDLLHAITQLSQPVPGRGPEHNQRIVAVLLDSLRCGTTQQPPAR